MRHFPRWAGRTDSDHLLASIDPQPYQPQGASAEPPRLQHLGEIGEQVSHDALDRLRGADGLQQAPFNDRHLCILARRDRLGDAPQRLI